MKVSASELQTRPRALILASVASMIDQFNMQNIQLLLENGYDVDVIANFTEPGNISKERAAALKNNLHEKGVSFYDVEIPRKLTKVKDIISSYRKVKVICRERQYSIVHCHSPIGGVICRFAARKIRKNGCRVIYTAHGFHFYKGAPLRNWILYYPIEKICSRLTDVLITINEEDYAFAKKHMAAGRVEYIPGVGVDTRKFRIENFDANSKKAELGITADDLLLLSVGELNQNKNHETIIRAIAKLKNSKVHYFIAGEGKKRQYLSNLAKEKDVNLHLLGYRTDIIELLNAADIYAFPSYREGLSVSLMEAMAAGLPCVVSRIRGNIDLIDDEGGFLCKPDDADAFSNGLRELLNVEIRLNMGEHNRAVMQEFDVQRIMEMVSGMLWTSKSKKHL